MKKIHRARYWGVCVYRVSVPSPDVAPSQHLHEFTYLKSHSLMFFMEALLQLKFHFND